MIIRAPFIWIGFLTLAANWPTSASASGATEPRPIAECCRRSNGGPPPITPPGTGQQ